MSLLVLLCSCVLILQASAAVTKDEVDLALNSKPIVVISHFSEANEDAGKAFAEAGASFKQFLQNSTALQLPEPMFFSIEDADVARNYGILYSPALKVYRKPEGEAEFDFFEETGFNANKILRFLKVKCFPNIQLEADDSEKSVPEQQADPNEPIVVSGGTVPDDWTEPQYSDEAEERHSSAKKADESSRPEDDVKRAKEARTVPVGSTPKHEEL